ncbi:hypothetical protein CPPEL_10940 [Corynebacterium pseudopelargi]|uniref:Uncharacterized protein n=1 Tax=Corynebacterium pseudopelargi TaxID=2080757 RepID=A0A3G6IWW5_9CORY|nr:hypothetical protein CPPEL_10940 [Corynebacterium pseudopelargi]
MEQLKKFYVYSLPGFLISALAALWLEPVSSGWTQTILLLVLLHFGMLVILLKWTWRPVRQPGAIWLSLHSRVCSRRGHWGGTCKSC